MKRTGRWVVAIVVAFALLAGGWVAASKLQSPAQRAAAASPPPPAAVTIAVEQGELADRINVRASIGPASTASAPIVLEDGRSVVTRVVAKRGARVAAGDHVLSINDRPLFVLPGRFPLYRDLTYLDRGSDVAQLQKGLEAAGHSIPSSEDGFFGASTRDGIDAMYRDAGFNPPRKAQAAEPNESTDAGTDSESQQGKKDAEVAPKPPAQVAFLAMSEVVIVRSLPMTLISAPALGTVLTSENAVVEFGSSQLRAEAKVPTTSTADLQPGMPVTIGEGESAVAATISKVTLPKGAAPGPAAAQEADGSESATDDGGEEATVVFAPDDGEEFPKQWSGTDQLVEITVREIAADALLVPTIAIAGSSTGETNVLVRQVDGTFLSVPVTELGASGGTSAIEPTSQGALKAGDLVRLDRP